MRISENCQVIGEKKPGACVNVGVTIRDCDHVRVCVLVRIRVVSLMRIYRLPKIISVSVVIPSTYEHHSWPHKFGQP